MHNSDWSLSAVAAGFVAVLVGFASSVAIVFQAATAAGANPDITASWIGILGFSMGITCIGFSWHYKTPILTAWSTPGAALLAASLHEISLAEAVGVFMFSAVLTSVLGLTGWFDKLRNYVPLPIAAAMLAGILLKFGLDLFISLKTLPELVCMMILAFLLAKRYLSRYAIPIVLLVGAMFCIFSLKLDFTGVKFEFVDLIWVNPQWSLTALLGIGIPLFLVTMTSQNIPGLAVLHNNKYKTPISPILSIMGLLTLLTAPFGNFSINLAAITAAICSGPEAHIDPTKRYIAGITAGVFYFFTGLASVTVVALFSIFPQQFVAALAGLALLGTIATTLTSVTADGEYRDAGMLTFLLTASGVSFFGISSAFWGLSVGLLAIGILNWRKRS